MFQHEISYDTAFHYHCLKNCIHQVLEEYGVADPYLYIDVSCSWRYRAIPGKLYQSEISTGYNNVWKEFQTFFQILTFQQDEEAEAFVSKKVNEKVPVIVVVDSYYLPYRNTYLKYHGSHAIIIVGETEDGFEIIDWYEPYFYRGIMDKQNMRKARSSSNSGSINPFCGEKIDRNTYLIESWKEEQDLQKLFLYGIHQIYESFYQRKSSLSNPFLAVGLGAVEKLASDMGKALMDESKAKELSEKLHDDFFMMNIARKIQRYYIKTYLSERGRDHEIISAYEAVIGQYETLLFQILKLKMRWSVQQVQEVMNQIHHVISSEKLCGIQLERLIQEMEES